MPLKKEFDVTVDSGIISIFQRQNYKLDRVFSEFVDNSLQSFLDHRDELKNIPDSSKCIVDITWDSKHILIRDNAYGMNDEEFGRALKLKAANPNAWKNDQLCVYGMGLKYAAVYLGNHYSISSTAFNSKTRFYAEVDVPTFEKENPETVEASLFDEFEEAHFTEIEITSVRIKKTVDKENDLRNKLAIIYNHYISKGLLTIRFNNIPVLYERPALWPKEDGGSFFEHFKDSFSINDKTYEFSGWIGILSKGNQSITGINLVQANRCIELGYKPEKMFGKGNSFQNSRLIGEIVFSGENYVLSFNKDTFVWADDGAEEAFVSKLIANSHVSYIIKMCKELRTDDDDEKIKAKTINVLKKSVKDLKVIDKKDEANKTDQKVEEPKKDDEKKDSELKPDDKVITNPTEEKEEEKYKKTSINVDGKEVPLFIDVVSGSPNDNWISFEKYNDGFILHVNYSNSFISNNFPNQSVRAASNTFAVLLVSSMLKAQNFGLKLSNSKILIDTLNSMMGVDDNE